VPVARLGWLPLLAGVALHEAVREAAGLETVLKWPNDLLAAPDEGKLAGILAQTSGEAVVIGIGLNVTTTAAELPVETATSLARCRPGADLDRTDLLVAILARLDARIGQWADFGGDAEACGLAADYRAACVTLGQPVRVALGDSGALEGVAVDVDEVGRLVVRTADGERTVSAGDVEHLRPA
jgi:BirA family biotin operon repressor/biotin-[acetyl-CoA-carboxylase] ligase